MSRLRSTWLLVAAASAACGGERAAELADRVAALERRLDAADAQQQRLVAALRENGIAVPKGPPRDAAEAREQAIDELASALVRLQSAKETQDNTKGQNAMAALERTLAVLRQDPASLPALFARAEGAPPAEQSAWLECCARAGGAAAAPQLLALVGAADRPPALRSAAARSLLTVDPAAAVPAIASLLQEPSPLPDLYLLVHLLAGTGKAEVVPVLTAALQHSRDRSVRCHAATGLGNFRGAVAADALAAAAVADEYPAVRTNALRALAQAAPGERLREVAARVAANDADAGVRAVARELAPAADRR